MTCNPNWTEITENIFPGQTASDRPESGLSDAVCPPWSPDIVSRVFDLKKDSLIEDITKKQIFGKIIAYIYVIEFQKRGLPHMHLLLSLEEHDKIKHKTEIDQFISTEIPDETADPELYRIVNALFLIKTNQVL